MADIRKVTVVGGGVIGGGWVARFLQNGIDVDVYDPDPEAERKLGGLLDNARRAFARLIEGRKPAPGRLRFRASLEEALAGADFVQESAPERLDLKQKLFAQIDALAPPHVLVASSTSGLLPTDLQAAMGRHPERLLVAHPFNPVYLVPLVELVGGRKTEPQAVERARAFYDSLGMKPIVIAKEIDAFVGDRLLEALWREALWLVKDGIATVEEIDDVIRYSFGLRWAQMGLFQVYRIAGGEAGMRHFMAQFGPCLQWPWTKLTEVPELTDELVDTIAEQSDAQARGLSIRELERIRDDNLVSIMRALARSQKGAGWGAGELLNAYEARLRGAAPKGEPLRLHRASVSPDWIDYNGHMTEFRYLQVLGDATDAVLFKLGLDEEYVAGGHSFYTVESHIRHLGQAHEGDVIAVETQVLAADAKRLKLFHTAVNETTGAVVATGEHLLLHVDAASGRAAPAGEAMAARLEALARDHGALPVPAAAGRRVGEPA